MRSPAEPSTASPARNRPHAVILDLDGVLRRWDPAIVNDAEELAGLPRGALGAAAFADARLLRAAVTGALSDEEWRAEIAHRLSRSFGPSAAAAVAAWSGPAGEVDHDVLALVRQVRARAPVALFSNATSRLPRDLAALGLVEEVDVIVNSSELGLAKPDADAFLAAASRCGRAPDECLFVDDTDANVLAARSVGMAAHHFTSAPELRARLTEVGLIEQGAY